MAHGGLSSFNIGKDLKELSHKIQVELSNLHGDIAAIIGYYMVGGKELLDHTATAKKIFETLDSFKLTTIKDANSIIEKAQKMERRLRQTESAYNKAIQVNINFFKNNVLEILISSHCKSS